MGTLVLGRFVQLPRRALWWALVDGDARSILDVRESVIDALTRAERASRARVWEWRAGAALAAALSDDLRVGELLPLALGAHVTMIATRIASDRVHEARLCRDLAARHRGTLNDGWPAVLPQARPSTKDPLLTVAAVCVVDAALASACLVEALSEAPCKLVGAALRDLLEVRVAHVRAGWSLLERLEKDERAGERFLDGFPALVRWGLERVARETPNVGGGAEGADGVLSTERRGEVARETVRDVLLPKVAALAVALNRPLFDLVTRVQEEVD